MSSLFKLALPYLILFNVFIFSGRRRCGRNVSRRPVNQGPRQQKRTQYNQVTQMLATASKIHRDPTVGLSAKIMQLSSLKTQIETRISGLRGQNPGSASQLQTFLMQSDLGPRIQRLQTQAAAEQERARQAQEEQENQKRVAEEETRRREEKTKVQTISPKQPQWPSSSEILGGRKRLITRRKTEAASSAPEQRDSTSAAAACAAEESVFDEGINRLAEQIQRRIDTNWNDLVALRTLFELIGQDPLYAQHAALLENRIQRLAQEQQRQSPISSYEQQISEVRARMRQKSIQRRATETAQQERMSQAQAASTPAHRASEPSVEKKKRRPQDPPCPPLDAPQAPRSSSTNPSGQRSRFLAEIRSAPSLKPPDQDAHHVRSKSLPPQNPACSAADASQASLPKPPAKGLQRDLQTALLARAAALRDEAEEDDEEGNDVSENEWSD